MDLVWATVFLTVVVLWGLSIIVAAQESGLIPTAVALMVGGLFQATIFLLEPGHPSRIIDAKVIAGHNVVVRLKRHAVATAMYGITKRFDRVALSLDEPGQLAQAIERRRPVNEPNTSGQQGGPS